MRQWIKGLSLISMVCGYCEIFGWTDAEYTQPGLQPPPPEPSIHFPLNQNQNWFIKPSYLIWRANQEDTDLGFSLVTDTDGTIDERVRDLNFEWGSGARLGIGWYLPNHQQWDISLTTTYMYNQSKRRLHGDIPATVVVPPPSGSNTSTTTQVFGPGQTQIVVGWDPVLLGNPIDAEFGLRMNYFTLDFCVGREYSFTQKVVLHPFIGLRGALIYQKYFDYNESPFPLATFTNNNPFAGVDGFTANVINTSFRIKNRFYGVGPRIGTDFSFLLGKKWSIMGNLAGSLLYSRYRIKERLNGGFVTDVKSFIFKQPILVPGNVAPVSVKIKDADNLLAANLDASIGLGWENWVSKNTIRIAPSVLFEVTKWYGFNHWIATDFASLATSTGVPDFNIGSERRKDGDLGFLGFTVNLQLDY